MQRWARNITMFFGGIADIKQEKQDLENLNQKKRAVKSLLSGGAFLFNNTSPTKKSVSINDLVSSFKKPQI